jgi:tripartite-type tricarboxylate transporter receptor subunit TctC
MTMLVVNTRALAIVAAIVAASHTPSSAQEFFKGKTVTLLVAGTAGGGIDIGARVMARHLGKYIPGNPNVVAQLMPGAGGIRMIDHMNKIAPRDGTVLGTVAPGPIIEPLIGKRQIGYRMTDFTMIAAMDKDVTLCIAWGASKFKTIKDVIATPMNVAGTGAGSSTDIYPIFLNEVMGTKFKVITGYLGSQETIIAIERGEVDGRCGWGWSSINSTKPDWVRDKKVTYLLQMALEKNPKIDAPLALDFAKDDTTRQMMVMMFGPLSLNKPFFGPPGMPAERTAELRKAFMEALKDKDLRAEAVKTFGDELEPTGGEAAQKLIADIYATPPAVTERLRGILSK